MAFLLLSFYSPAKPAYMEFIDVDVSFDDMVVSVITFKAQLNVVVHACILKVKLVLTEIDNVSSNVTKNDPHIILFQATK